tara:strand:+ start:195 stop:1184 length:990 start_codon:yes stop_codon:yes gene_type:complete
MNKESKSNDTSKFKENSDRTLLVLIGFSCNNNCIVCSVRPKRHSYPDRSYQEVVKDIKQGRKNGFNRIEFTGGETTIRKDIIQLVAQAKKQGYQQIGLSTNGRLFSYQKFCQEIIKAGLNRITFSLLGFKAETHNAITRTPGSFDEIIAGMKNVQKFPKAHINISSVISKLNFRHLEEFGKFIHSLGVRQWYLLDLIPDGHAKTHYRTLVVRLNDLYKELNSISKIADDFEEFGFFDFPYCLFKPALRKRKNVCLVNAKMRVEISKQIGYNPERISVNKQGSYTDVYRLNIDICKKCKFYKECGGVWKPYLNLYGPEEIISLSKKNNCF